MVRSDSELIVTHLLEPKSGFQELADAVKGNRDLSLRTIDMTGTKISKTLGSSGPSAFADALLHFHKGLNALVLNFCELNAKVGVRWRCGRSRTRSAPGVPDDAEAIVVCMVVY
jgi:hypothetical protein